MVPVLERKWIERKGLCFEHARGQTREPGGVGDRRAGHGADCCLLPGLLAGTPFRHSGHRPGSQDSMSILDTL